MSDCTYTFTTNTDSLNNTSFFSTPLDALEHAKGSWLVVRSQKGYQWFDATDLLRRIAMQFVNRTEELLKEHQDSAHAGGIDPWLLSQWETEHNSIPFPSKCTTHADEHEGMILVDGTCRRPDHRVDYDDLVAWDQQEHRNVTFVHHCGDCGGLKDTLMVIDEMEHYGVHLAALRVVFVYANMVHKMSGWSDEAKAQAEAFKAEVAEVLEAGLRELGVEV